MSFRSAVLTKNPHYVCLIDGVIILCYILIFQRGGQIYARHVRKIITIRFHV